MNGTPSTSISEAVAPAIRTGRRITMCESRYQYPDDAGRAEFAEARWKRRGARLSTRRPRRASTAGRKRSATPAPISDTSIPPMPIERRKLCGKTSSEASAAATVTALKSTVRPAVRSVSRSAFEPGPWTAISSR